MTFHTILFLLLSVGRAESATSVACDLPIRSVVDVLACADRMSPEVQKALLDVEQAKLQIGAYAQWKNPELSATSFGGTIAGSRQTETDIMLGVPLELGGKRGARRAVGEAGRDQAEAALFSARAKVRIATILNLHRLRQLGHEAAVVDESIKAFSTLNDQFSSRSRLSPEQQTSATVYRMARSQYQLKRSEINDEISELNKYFLITVGRSEAELKPILPGTPASWPSLEDRSVAIESPRLRSAKANFTLAQANLDLAKSEAWPTVNVGPSFRMQNQGGVSGNLLGINVGLPIPLFNVNGAGRAAAAAGVAVSEATRDLELRSELTSRDQWENVYDQSVKLLKTTLSHQDIERAHHDIDGLFIRGVVPSALVIEAHRSYLDLEVTRNSRERKAMEALLSIYEINGSIMEKIL